MISVWLSHPKFTGRVGVVSRGKTLWVQDPPPVWKKFKYQTLASLVAWLEKSGDVEMEEL